MTNKVVIYSPIEDFWYNSDLGSAFLLWFACFALAAFIVAAGAPNAGRKQLKPWMLVVLTICATYTLHCGAVWALVHL